MIVFLSWSECRFVCFESRFSQRIEKKKREIDAESTNGRGARNAGEEGEEEGEEEEEEEEEMGAD